VIKAAVTDYDYLDLDSWTKVKRPDLIPFHDLETLCKEHKSNGRFILIWAVEHIWFEKSEDATWLMLWHA
jgi:hypothetical protein